MIGRRSKSADPALLAVDVLDPQTGDRFSCLAGVPGRVPGLEFDAASYLTSGTFCALTSRVRFRTKRTGKAEIQFYYGDASIDESKYKTSEDVIYSLKRLSTDTIRLEKVGSNYDGLYFDFEMTFNGLELRATNDKDPLITKKWTRCI